MSFNDLICLLKFVRKWSLVSVTFSLALVLPPVVAPAALQSCKLQPSTAKYFYFLHRRWFLIGQHSLPGVPGDNTKLQSWNMQRMSPVTSLDSPLTSHLKHFRWKSFPSARSFFTFVSPFRGTIIFPQPPHVEQNFLMFQFQKKI